MNDKCKSCLKLKKANELKLPIIIVPVGDNDGFRWCRRCYQDTQTKLDVLKEAYDYRLYIDACHGMKHTPLSSVEWKEWRK